jgi:aspartate carbamoyltransferase regulatory subunit
MYKLKKEELAVAALENGTVIDHIPTQSLFKVVNLLGIKNLKNSVTIGFNLDSSKCGKKGIIKVADVFFPEETPQPNRNNCAKCSNQHNPRL